MLATSQEPRTDAGESKDDSGASSDSSDDEGDESNSETPVKEGGRVWKQRSTREILVLGIRVRV